MGRAHDCYLLTTSRLIWPPSTMHGATINSWQTLIGPLDIAFETKLCGIEGVQTKTCHLETESGV
jgi:hypothetical protein